MLKVPGIIPTLDRLAFSRFIYIYSVKIIYKVHTHTHIYIYKYTHKNKCSDPDFPTTITSRHSSLKHDTNYIQIEVSSDAGKIFF